MYRWADESKGGRKEGKQRRLELKREKKLRMNMLDSGGGTDVMM
jgi:hypothetical protein